MSIVIPMRFRYNKKVICMEMKRNMGNRTVWDMPLTEPYGTPIFMEE